MTTLTYEYENIRFTCSPMGNKPDGRYVVNATRISDGRSLHAYGGKRRGIDQAFFQSDTPPTQEFFEQVCQYKMLEALGNFEPEGTRCYACAAWLDAGDDTDYQFDNALWVTFDGGYGMFIDPMREQYKAVICHECAHKLCDENPWIEQLLNSFNSHAHRTDVIPGLVAQGHQGWDLVQYHDGTTPIPDHKDQTD